MSESPDFTPDENGWMPISAPVLKAMRDTGPAGCIEFNDDCTAWRAVYGDRTVWRG